MLMVFRIDEKDYCGSTALEVVRAMEADAAEFSFSPGQSIKLFLRWSLNHLGNRIPPREMDLSDRIRDEDLALNYLYLRDEYGAGKFMVKP